MTAKEFLQGEFIIPVANSEPEKWCFAYAERSRGRYKHIIVLQVAAGLSDDDTNALLSSMHKNPSLDRLKIDKDYVWGGSSVIGFRLKENAALFRMFVS